MSTHHAARFRFYRDAARNSVDDLALEAAYGEGEHLLDSLVVVRWVKERLQWEFQVNWLGLDPLEATLKPAINLMEDVPEFMRAFITDKSDDETVQRICSEIQVAPTTGRKDGGEKREEGNVL
uniref:AlNc14C148G7435 protein n=1 Tax=Albugo laibachii Nc14 TaxID=890382 RepID=F0WLQ3_9STRA|nr:AlNc14C148G7435 [Albugo laibachii Nc14]|eukprot:CCA22225.1 AlNc14C148G7435 [Albugo laibachii Nc14]